MRKILLKILMGILIIPILVFLGFTGYQKYLAPPQPTPTSLPASIEQDEGAEIISVEGKLVPFEYAQLNFKTPGLVEAVKVVEGDLIQSGAVIASLEGREQLAAALTAAKMDLISAEQALEELINLAPLQTAQAQQALAYARDELEDAQHRWNSYQEGNRASNETIQATEKSLTEANSILARAEQEYNQYANRPEGDPLRAISYSALVAARQARNRLLSQLNWYKGSPSSTDQAMLDADLAVAEGRLAEAERQWELVKDGPDKEKIELAQARVESVEAQLAAAQSNLDDLELRAPFTGTIISLNLKVGESVSLAVPVVVIADISRWQVETIDLTENDFALISPGMEAIITLNAYPEREFHGVVREISLLGEDRRGSVTYTVTLDFDPENAKVQWGMTAFVDIPIR